MARHRLLLRQLRKHLGPDVEIPPAWQGLLQSVEEAYDQFDTDRRILECAMDFSSRELFETNARLVQQNDRSATVLTRLRTIAQALAPAGSESPVSPDDALALSDTIEELVSQRAAAMNEVSSMLRHLALEQEQRAIAEDQRGHEAQKYRTLFEDSTDAILLISQGAYIDCNRRAETLFQLNRKEFLGQIAGALSPSVQPDGRNSIERSRETILAATAGNPQVLDWQYRRRDGTCFDAEVSLRRIEMSGAEAVQVVIHDISERKRAEAVLRESEAKFAEAFRHSPVGMGIRDLKSDRYLDVNDRCVAMMGYSREEVVGRTPDEIGWMDETDHAKNRQSLNVQNGVRDQPVRLRRKDGVFLHCLYTAHVVQIGGRPCVLSVTIDVTNQKHAEEALRASEAKFAKVFQSSPVAISISSLETGEFLEVNDAFLRASGYTAGEIIGKSSIELGGIEPQARQKLVEKLQTEGRFVGLERAVVAKGGRHVDCIYGGEIIEIGGQRRLLSIMLDVTESRRLEAQLRQSQKIEAVGLLAGGVAHDFNNVLAAILLQLGLLSEDRHLDPQNLNILQELEREVTRAAGLTRQLLAFSRRQVMQVKPVDLNALIMDLLQMLRRLLGENIAITWQGMERLPAIDADVGMIEQVVMNLCVNARDAMPGGGKIAIETTTVIFDSAVVNTNPEARPGGFVRLSVSDTGCGMDPSTRQHLFEPFFTTKELGKGTGLGLATVHGIVKQHSGWIEVETALGRGSVFHIFLPARTEAFSAAVEQGRSALPWGKCETVLVVEDEEPVRLLLTLTLRRFGYKVIEAGSGPDALRQWEQHRAAINLVLTDMVMPDGMSGAELVERLRAEDANVRAIICSGHLQDRAGASRCGIALLAKPFDVKTLLAAVRKCLDESASAD